MLDLLMSRKSIRKYKDRPVEKEKIDKIIAGALTAPTGHNTRSWEIFVVENKENLKKLADARGFHSRFMADAPLGFVIMSEVDQAVTWQADTAIIASYIQLMGQSLGLGSCWIQTEGVIADDGSDMEENVKDILKLPEKHKYRVLCMISMGYPDQVRKKHNPEAFNYKKVHYEKF